MNSNPLDRRDFHLLAAAALGGLASGAIVGCGSKEEPATVASGPQHLCRGLNDCKEQGKQSANGCRGRGLCATVKLHSCAGQNDCKGLGGCGATAGANDCKGKGGCAVPLMDSAWTKVRQRMEGEWKQKQATFGAAPAKEEKSPSP